MSKINWIVRLRNRSFWLAFIPAMLLLVQQVANILGVPLDYSQLGLQAAEVINTLFILLAILGIVVDPTTEGIQDSSRALSYDRPHENKACDGNG